MNIENSKFHVVRVYFYVQSFFKFSVCACGGCERDSKNVRACVRKKCQSGIEIHKMDE